MIAMPSLSPRERNHDAFSAVVDALDRRRALRETFVECPVCGFELVDRPSPDRLLFPRALSQMPRVLLAANDSGVVMTALIA